MPNWLNLLLNFDEVSALMALPEGSRERRRAERWLCKRVNFSFMRSRGAQQYRQTLALWIMFSVALVLTPILWILRTPETERLMSWDVPWLAAIFAEFFFLAAILLPRTLALRQSIFRDSLRGFWSEAGKLPPDALARLRALLESAENLDHSQDEVDPAEVIACCLDCCMIYPLDPEAPDCPRCGSRNAFATRRSAAPSHGDLRTLAELLDRELEENSDDAE